MADRLGGMLKNLSRSAGVEVRGSVKLVQSRRPVLPLEGGLVVHLSLAKNKRGTWGQRCDDLQTNALDR
jgi:hypothetical protein